MSEFKLFNEAVQQQFQLLVDTGKLFRAKITGTELWKLYLDSFEDGDDPIFRDPESSSHSCNNCNNFIRRYGNIIAVDSDGNIITLFGGKNIQAPYKVVAEKMNAKLIQAGIAGVFVETFSALNSLPYEACKKNQELFQLGMPSNIKLYNAQEAAAFGVVKEGDLKTFYHFNLKVPNQFIDKSGKSVEALEAEYRDKYSVFKRAMEEIPFDTLNLVKDLINQGSLLDGTAHLHAVEEMMKYATEHQHTKDEYKDQFYWTTTYSMHERAAKFKNNLIGVLCSDLAEGEELNSACKKWNIRVDPVNYNKATAPITKRQIEEAKKFVEENGYTESFNRRLATIDDIKVDEIKHINSGDGKIKEVSIFDNVKSTSTRHKKSKFDGIEEVTIEHFMDKILPGCTKVEAFVKNNYEGNLAVLTTAKSQDSKPIFKWDNLYSWTFNGNLAGKSQLAEMVEAKGGRTDGAFRFTHSWNELEPNQSLMDLHVFMPGCALPKQWEGGPDIRGRRVGWNRRNDVSGGSQDVDYTQRAPVGYIPVENITFPNINDMPEGTYTCMIHNWSFRGTGGRGKAEIAFGGEIFQYEYPKTKNHEWITVAEVTLKGGKFSIDHKLPETNTSKELWGIDTNEFHKVDLVCLSPNHWGDNSVGNKHYFFMLEGCKAPTSVRGFHNENLIPDLLKHRKVMEVLGSTAMIEPTDKHLAGLGFNSTVRDELIVKCSGSFNRTLKIKF